HYTNGEVGDVWHWKAVRTNPMGIATGEPGFMDDQHFRGPDPIPAQLKPGERYMGGYYADPSPGGGYAYNFEKLDPTKPLAETFVRPKMLPARRAVILSADPTESDHDATWWIDKAQGIPYTAAADTYPVGALIPNIILEPFQGDRAHIRARAAELEAVTLPGTGDSQDLLRALAQSYAAQYPGRQVTVPNSIGSDGGVRVVGTEESPIGRVSRLPNAAEVAKYGEFKYLEFARVPVAFVVSRETGVRDLSQQQICDIFSGRVTNWKEVGGHDLLID